MCSVLSSSEHLCDFLQVFWRIDGMDDGIVMLLNGFFDDRGITAQAIRSVV